MNSTLDPFRIIGPACISFSGGRTSAYMLRRILNAHGGELPADVHAVFANTGKERLETLDFVHECAAHWGDGTFRKDRPSYRRMLTIVQNTPMLPGLDIGEEDVALPCACTD